MSTSDLHLLFVQATDTREHPLMVSPPSHCTSQIFTIEKHILLNCLLAAVPPASWPRSSQCWGRTFHDKTAFIRGKEHSKSVSMGVDACKSQTQRVHPHPSRRKATHQVACLPTSSLLPHSPSSRSILHV